RLVTERNVESLRLTAIRHVRLGVTDATAQVIRDAIAAVPGVSELRVATDDRAGITATIEGDIDPFVKAVSRFHVTDLVVEEPDLEESVLRLYNIAPEESTNEQ